MGTGRTYSKLAYGVLPVPETNSMGSGGAPQTAQSNLPEVLSTNDDGRSSTPSGALFLPQILLGAVMICSKHAARIDTPRSLTACLLPPDPTTGLSPSPSSDRPDRIDRRNSVRVETGVNVTAHAVRGDWGGRPPGRSWDNGGFGWFLWSVASTVSGR